MKICAISARIPSLGVQREAGDLGDTDSAEGFALSESCGLRAPTSVRAQRVGHPAAGHHALQHHGRQRQRQKVATASPNPRVTCLRSVTFEGWDPVRVCSLTEL